MRELILLKRDKFLRKGHIAGQKRFLQRVCSPFDERRKCCEPCGEKGRLHIPLSLPLKNFAR
jgi:hypothetical protein